MGAYGLAVVATFAVALAVLLSVSSTAEAAVLASPTDTTPLAGAELTMNNGATVYISNSDGTAAVYARFWIETVGGASASFTHASAIDEGQTIVCLAETACDADPDSASVEVELKIDADSGAGAIFVRSEAVDEDATTTITLDTITVVVAQAPTNLTAKLDVTSIDSGQDSTAGNTYVDIRLTDENAAGIAGKTVTVVSTRAVLSTATTLIRPVSGETAILLAYVGAELAGGVVTSVDGGTDDDVDTRGYARVQVTGGGAPGISTITVTHGDLTASVDLVLHGPVKTITAESEQSAIEVGGKTFIVVTATDSAGNPVADKEISVKAKGGVTPPAKLDVAVMPIRVVNKDKGTAGTVDKGDIPSCDRHAAVLGAEGPPVVVAQFVSTGTNTSGQCVIEVSAPNPSGTANDAARGPHTIVIVASDEGDEVKGVDEVTVVIDVGGAPATIESDAPERIDPSDELTVNITVLDDEAVLVGGVTIEVVKTAGDGAIITPVGAMTSDGRAKFTYLAPSTPGVAEFLVRTRDADNAVTSKLPIIIDIAEAVEEPVEPPPDETPDPPMMEDATLSGSGALRIFSGGSVEDLQAAAEAACAGGADVWVQDADGGWQLYRTSAPAFANSPFAAAFPDGLGLQAVFVSACDEGSMMGNEG